VCVGRCRRESVLPIVVDHAERNFHRHLLETLRKGGGSTLGRGGHKEPSGRRSRQVLIVACVARTQLSTLIYYGPMIEVINDLLDHLTGHRRNQSEGNCGVEDFAQTTGCYDQTGA